jgi:hypothetical protein
MHPHTYTVNKAKYKLIYPLTHNLSFKAPFLTQTTKDLTGNQHTEANTP